MELLLKRSAIAAVMLTVLSIPASAGDHVSREAQVAGSSFPKAASAFFDNLKYLFDLAEHGHHGECQPVDDAMPEIDRLLLKTSDLARQASQLTAPEISADNTIVCEAVASEVESLKLIRATGTSCAPKDELEKFQARMDALIQTYEPQLQTYRCRVGL